MPHCAKLLRHFEIGRRIVRIELIHLMQYLDHLVFVELKRMHRRQQPQSLDVLRLSLKHAHDWRLGVERQPLEKKISGLEQLGLDRTRIHIADARHRVVHRVEIKALQVQLADQSQSRGVPGIGLQCSS